MSQVPEFERYPFRIEPLAAEEGGGFLITFPDLPGCMSDGATYEEAIANGREAFEAWMTVQLDEGQLVPRPSGEGVPAKFVQRLPQSLHAQVLARAAADGVSMNTFITVLIAEGLARREARGALSAIEQRANRLLAKLDEIETRATIGWDTVLVKQEVRGYPLRQGAEEQFAEVSSGTAVHLLNTWIPPRAGRSQQ